MSESVEIRDDRPLAGIGYIVVSMATMASLDAVAKHLVATLPVIEMLALRGIVMALILCVWLPKVGGLRHLRTDKPWGHIRRAGYALAAPLLFFTAIRELPLADITVLVFGGSFFMTALSVPLLGEKVGWFRWSAIGVGFVGVLVAAQPTGENFGFMTFIAVSASIAYALLVIETRRLGGSDSAYTMTFYTTIGTTAAFCLATPFLWVPVTDGAWPWIVALAVLALGSHVLMAKAFMLAPVSTIAPFEYTSLVWAAIFGYYIFDEIPGNNVWLGAVIIIAAGIFIVQREAQLTRSKKPTQPTIAD